MMYQLKPLHYGSIIDTIKMNKIEKVLLKMNQSSSNISFDELHLVCSHFFGAPRSSGGSHFIYKTPWKGDPRINIQNNSGKAKTYQVKQVLKAIDHLKHENKH